MSDGDRPVELDIANRRASVGAGTSTVTSNDAIPGIKSWIAKREHNCVCVAGVRGVNEGRPDLQLHEIDDCAGMVVPDGMPLFFMARRPGFRLVSRVHGPDLIPRPPEKQERWMASHLNRLDVPVLIGVGAAFDFLAGAKSQPPDWMQPGGWEWLYRMCCGPRRLWRRYARSVSLLITLFWGRRLPLGCNVGSESG